MKNFNAKTVSRKCQFVHALFKKLLAIGVNTTDIAMDPRSGTFRYGRMGLYCGTGMDRNMMTHELAHIIQPTDADFARLYLEFEGSVHFSVPSVFICGQWCVEPHTDQIGRRELDTFAVEYLLAKQLKTTRLSFDDYACKQIALLQYLPDWYMWKSSKKAELYLKARVLDWQDVDLVSVLNRRLAEIKAVSNWDQGGGTYYTYAADQDSVIVCKLDNF